MKAIPDKSQAICIDMKSHDNIDSFQVGQSNIKCGDNVTLLGIYLVYVLKFDDHISEICKKISYSAVSNFKAFGSIFNQAWKTCYLQLFIASNFSYCPLTRNFCSVSSTNKLEKIQEMTLSFISNDYSSSIGDLLKLTSTQPLRV